MVQKVFEESRDMFRRFSSSWSEGIFEESSTHNIVCGSEGFQREFVVQKAFEESSTQSYTWQKVFGDGLLTE